MHIICVVMLFYHAINGARILSVYPVPSVSHQIVFRTLTQELARRDHKLVVIAPALHVPTPSENVIEFDLHDLTDTIWRTHIANMASRKGETPVEIFHNVLIKSGIEMMDAQMHVPAVKYLLNNQFEYFDLVILQCAVRTAYIFTHRFKAPVIGFTSFTALQYNYDSMGVPTHSLLYPDMLQLKVRNLSLWEKANAIYTDLWQRYVYWKVAREENEVGKKHFGDSVADVQELASNTDLLFINVNPLWDGIRPVPSSVIYVGGMHINPPKILPMELQVYMDGCNHGVIYMSLGNNIKSSELPLEKVKIFLQVFMKLRHCVIWKWETTSWEQDLKKPDNVRFQTWFPQTDLLAHPNMRAFITQGGLQSADEAIRAKVPLIGIPFMSDQGRNVEEFVNHGIGVGLDIQTITTVSLSRAIQEVTTKKSFRRNLDRLNLLIEDDSMKPLERAVWWTEYLLRHGSARHLRSPATDVSFYEYWMLDMLAAALGAILTCFLLFGFVLRILFIQAGKLSTKQKNH